MKADFEITVDFSTSVFTCADLNCGKVIEPGAKILFVNGRQRDLCAGCAGAYLKSLAKKLDRIDGCTYTIRGMAASSGRRTQLTCPPDAVGEKDIDIQFERDGSRCLVVCSVTLDDDGGSEVVCAEISGMRVVGEVKVG
jgi:hypothetical protein